MQTSLSDERYTSRSYAAIVAQQPGGLLATALNQPLILLVESEPRLASFLDRALTAAGYRLERSADGQPAVSRVEELAPDIVLLDIVLPSMDTLELVRQLRARSDAPIVMLAISNVFMTFAWYATRSRTGSRGWTQARTTT